MDAQRELLDSLMGKNRNEDKPGAEIHVRGRGWRKRGRVRLHTALAHMVSRRFAHGCGYHRTPV